MKKYYWFLLLFIGWIIGSSLWYLYGVKGVINADPHYFDPHTRLLAIVEIFTMLLVACLLGYAIAWWLRQDTIENQEEQDATLIERITLQQADNEELNNKILLWSEKHRHDLTECQQKQHEVNTEKENLQQRFHELEILLAQTRQEFLLAQTQHQQSENDSGTLRYKIRQLEYQNKELAEANEKLQTEIADLHSLKRERSFSEHPFVRPAEPDEKDDLTQIKGIGPFIEKRLNMIGIYTLQQLSELTPEMIDRVGAAIEFFPHRILKDDWAGQAKKLLGY